MPIAMKFSKNGNALELEKKLEKLSEIANKRRLKLLTHSGESLNKFNEMNQMKQEEILRGLSTYLEILSNVSSLEAEKEEVDFDDEIECLESALNEFGMEFGDDDRSFIDTGDIIELYSLDNFQLYRNFQFLRVNPYDLLTILCHDWPTLYERPKTVTAEIAKVVGSVLDSKETKAVPFNIPSHTMKACAKYDQVLVEINLKYIKPVFSKKSGKKVGFVATQSDSPVLLDGLKTESVKMFK